MAILLDSVAFFDDNNNCDTLKTLATMENHYFGPGLDPPQLVFPKTPDVRGLHSSNAQNVDVIHTSVLGYAHKIGHADFYVNGGMIQPGCSKADGK